MMTMRVVATLCTLGTLLAVSPGSRLASSQTTRGGLATPPVVSATTAPAGTDAFKVQWVKVAVRDVGVMIAAIARPPGVGPLRESR